MYKRPHYLALSLVVLLVVALLVQSSRTTARLKLAIAGFFLPMFGLSGSAQQLTDKAGTTVTPKAELARQLERVRHENEALRVQIMRLEEVERENQRLRGYLATARQFPVWRPKLARVIGREPANWWRNIKIDLGSRDGLTNNLPVISPSQGLVGRLSEVNYSYSTVVLLGDPDCRVSVLVEGEKNREHGVIAPGSSGPLDNSIIDLGFLSRNAELKPGQRVHTSGMGGIFPKGILIGQVVDSHVAGFGLYREARVKLAVNISSLEEVWVMMP